MQTARSFLRVSHILFFLYVMVRLATLPLVLLLSAVGCSAPQTHSSEAGALTGPMTTAGSAELDEMFVLEHSASATVDGLIVRFDHITEDSRCPAEVNCVWEGRATISLSLIANGVANAVQLSIPGYVGTNSEPQDMQTAQAMGYGVTLLQLDPYPGVDGMDATLTPMVTLRVNEAD